jgi:endo-1,4-beta-mannosidase
MIPTLGESLPIASAIAERLRAAFEVVMPAATFEQSGRAPRANRPRMSRFLLGINYWPRRSAMYMWQRFDLGEIREDAARIRELGLDVVRFFLSWESFQPSPGRVDTAALGRFESMMDALADSGLRAMPTLFCGHMSGVNWLPPWSLDPRTPHGRFRTIANGNASAYGIGDFYADPRLLEAQVTFARAAGACVREFSNLREPNSPSDAAQWSVRLSAALRETSSGDVTGGMHGEDLERDRHIRPSSIAQPWDFATMHGYSVYGAFSRGRLDTNVVPFLCQLQASCSGKSVLFSEFGNPTCPPGTVSPYDRVPLPGETVPQTSELPANAAPYACLNEDEMADYADGAIDRLHARGALGAFWWCWADYDRTLADLPPFDLAPHELNFGIVRSDGTYKPVAQTLARFAREGRDVVEPPPAPIVADEAAFYASLPDGISDLYRRYCNAYA